jgi:hypothetical protein
MAPLYDTNQLYLQITNVSNGWAYLNLHNATNQVYSIWTTTNLLTPCADWRVVTELWPTTDQTNVLALTVSNVIGQSCRCRQVSAKMSWVIYPPLPFNFRLRRSKPDRCPARRSKPRKPPAAAIAFGVANSCHTTTAANSSKLKYVPMRPINPVKKGCPDLI